MLVALIGDTLLETLIDDVGVRAEGGFGEAVTPIEGQIVCVCASVGDVDCGGDTCCV